MIEVTYLIIGGGVAGTTAAETIRQHDPTGSIVIVSDEPYRLYSRIMLSKPNFFLEKIPFEQVWLKTEAWYAQNHVQLFAGKRATNLDAAKKEVTLGDGATVRYEKLLLALGGEARRWDVSGADKEGVRYLRTLDEAKAIIAKVKTAKHVVAIGGGFVSFEMCEMLRMAGLEVTLVLRDTHYWGSFLDEPSAQMIEAALEKGGVKLVRNAQVREVQGARSVTGVALQDGVEIPCEMVIVGIGIAPNVAWLKPSGLAISRGVLANEYLETNLPDVWTAGDVAEFTDLILDDRVQLGNWVNAQVQGKVAGLNMVGQKQPFKLVSFYTTQGFGINIAFVGDARPGPDRQVISRGSKEVNSYGRMLVKNNEIVGATLLNRTQELGVISKLIEQNVNVSQKVRELGDASVDLKTLLQPVAPPVQPAGKALPAVAPTAGKIKLGWFSFSCCEDNTVVMTEIMNDHWQEWKKLFDFRHARVLKSQNIFDEFDIAFIEGAIASKEHEDKLKEIRAKSKKLVAVGACAIVGMPAGQRNTFTPEQNAEIQYLIARFAALPKVLKVSEVVKVDAEIPGCPMEPKKFLEVVGKVVNELTGSAA